MQSNGYGAFLADVNLSADVQWNGTLKLTWMTAQVCGMASGGAPQTNVVATTTPLPPSTTQTMVATRITEQSQTTSAPQGTDTPPTTAPTSAASTSVAPTSTAPTTQPTETTPQTSTQGTTGDTTTATDAPFLAPDTSSPDNSSRTTQAMTLPPTTDPLPPAPPSLPPGAQVPVTDPPTLPPLTGTVMTAVTYTFNITYGDGINLHIALLRVVAKVSVNLTYSRFIT